MTNYEQSVFWRCIPPNSRGLARVIYEFNPSFFDTDFALVRAVAKATSVQEIRKEVDVHRYHNPALGLLRGRLKVRVSGQRLVNLGAKVYASLGAQTSHPDDGRE